MISGMPPRHLRLLRLAVDVRPGEVRALLFAFGYFFLLLSGYYLLRPLRETIGTKLGSKEFPWLYTATFVSSLLLVPLYGWLVVRVPRRRLVPLVYRFFALNMVLIFALWRLGVAQEWVGRVFFVWISVYNLLVVSVMWSVMADSWSPDQGKRLFGFIAAGGSAGALVGPSVSHALAHHVEEPELVLAAAVLLELAAQCMRRLPTVGGAPAADRPVGGGILDGLKRALSNPFLLAICALILIYAITNTFLYSKQADIIGALIPDEAERRQIFSLQDLFVNVVAIVLQAGVTGRVMSRVGVGVALAVTPLMTLFGFSGLLIAPTVVLIDVVWALRRAAHFAFDRPSREVLFTTVPRDDKYKSKNFIDTVVFRGGDVVAAWAFTGLGALAVPVAIPLSLAWLGAALYLSRAHTRRAAHLEGEKTP